MPWIGFVVFEYIIVVYTHKDRIDIFRSETRISNTLNKEVSLLKKIVYKIVCLLILLKAGSALSNNSDWIFQPYKLVKGGLPAVGCSSSSGDFGVDSMEAVMLAQSNLNTQISNRIVQMKKRISEKRTTANKALSSSVFEQLATTFSEGALINAQTQRTEYVRINDTEQMCALVVLPNDSVKAMLHEAIKQPKSSIKAENESILYLEFIKSELVQNH